MRLLSIILIFAYSLPGILQVCVLGDYVVRQDYYAEVLCVNKDKPGMCCKGKCQIASILDQEEERGGEPVLPSLILEALDFNAVPLAEENSNTLDLNSSVKQPSTSDDILELDFSHLIFVPPEVMTLV